MNEKLNPEELDLKMDMLDVLGLDDVETRLPLIEGIEYTRPRSWNQVFRDNDGGAPVPSAL